jgi:osmotically inducible lipoprotein OsmB
MHIAIKITPVIVGGALLLSACGTTMEERAATGALGGAVAGQVIGGDTTSTVVGGVAGAAVGAATTPR